MEDAIAFALGNFTLSFFVLGLLASAIALWRTRQPRTPAVVLEALFSFFLLFSIAFANLYNFVLHVFFGKVAAAFIGWEDSPFQLEVGFASLGFAALGLLAVQGKLRSATGGHRRAGLLSMGRGRRSRLSDDYHAQFCSRQCWCHFLQRCLGSDLRLHISLATTQRSPNTSVAMRARCRRKWLRGRAVGARTNREHRPRSRAHAPCCGKA
jgi:Family of unknown function (DUF6790)